MRKYKKPSSIKRRATYLKLILNLA